jgi:FdhD protein
MDEDRPMMYRQTDVRLWKGGTETEKPDFLVTEEPLEIRVNDLSAAVTMRTPGQDEALAVGFLATESILRSPADLYDVLRCSDPDEPHAGNVVNVHVDPERIPRDQDSRQRYANSSCGLCGRATVDHAIHTLPRLDSDLAIQRSLLTRLPDALRAAQPVFSRTGGNHAAGLFSREGELLFVAEDIGRHNTVDKVVGRAFLSGRWPLTDTLLMVSGRGGFEIVQKSLAVRIPVVCSVSAPSSLAVDLAREAGMILVGFLRGESMNVYAGADRIVSSE